MAVTRTIVVGAGIAGLTVARELASQGREVVVLEKSRSLGGRCATRNLDGQLVDHGVPYLHGRGVALRGLLHELGEQGGGTLVWDWPFHVRGPGVPCRPDGFDSRSFRAVVREGLAALGRHLGRGVDVRLEQQVARIARGDGTFEVETPGGTLSATSLVLTAPAPQTVALLEGLAHAAEELRGLLHLLSKQVFSLPCLTVMALYDRDPEEHWHLALPGPRSIVHSLINDSAKRGPGARQALVVQATPSFSRRAFDEDPRSWSQTLLATAAAELGTWADAPAVCETHRWRYARLQGGTELRRPALLRWADGAALGLCGEGFDPAGGVEGAFLSGIALARSLAAGEGTDAS